MFFPLRPLLDPASNQLDLLWRKLLPEAWRRHVLIGVRGGQSPKQFALLWIAGDKYSMPITIDKELLLVIQPQIGFAFLGIWPVTLKANVGQDRSDVAIEEHSLIGG